ncbi:hypothetical protein [Crateriforma conspicua]|uniref:hypothetical protein n=1 Tax=Crateriforma conspicua TaxID=2527996 RepID=UPI00118C3173|nr:hypothetical protein [Crateriforma conspicua]QDV62616.1 hypothetical protein Mal65_17500 [Crateriforma conspicua]
MRTVNEINGRRPRPDRLEVLRKRYAARQTQAANCCLKAATLDMLSELTDYVNYFEPEGIYAPEDSQHVYPALQRFYDGLMELNAQLHDDIGR